MPVAYYSKELTFEVYSEDESLVGLQEITLRAYLEDYQTIGTPPEKALIDFVDSCAAPTDLSVPTLKP